jgi:phosphatidylserine/phosphatidylglycerophosphate/cardiolipin synthase-like enzyme
MILKGIAEARRFIYMEDQYLVDPDPESGTVSTALLEALGRIEHMTVLIPADSITPVAAPLQESQTAYRRSQFLSPLLRQYPDKLRVFILKDPRWDPGSPNTYVHSKIYMIDDEFAIIGSCNCDRRDWTHDSQVVAGICDEPGAGFGYGFAHRLRMALWARHLNMDMAELVDGVASAVHWLDPPEGARIARYVPAAVTPAIGWDVSWNTLLDPDGS